MSEKLTGCIDRWIFLVTWDLSGTWSVRGKGVHAFPQGLMGPERRGGSRARAPRQGLPPLRRPPHRRPGPDSGWGWLLPFEGGGAHKDLDQPSPQPPLLEEKEPTRARGRQIPLPGGWPFVSFFCPKHVTWGLPLFSFFVTQMSSVTQKFHFVRGQCPLPE